MPRRRNPIAFLSEGTIEFLLLADLLPRMKERFGWVLPMRFVSTREASHVADEMLHDRAVRVVTFFARRPKILQAGQPSIVVKINSELSTYARASQAAGISVFAGVPLCSDTLTAPTAQHVWWHLNPSEKDNNDTLLDVTLDGRVRPVGSEAAYLPRLVRAEDLVDAMDRCLPLDKDCAFSLIKGLREHLSAGGGFPFFSGYRPVHLVTLAEPIMTR